jgi:hypothetical protein
LIGFAETFGTILGSFIVPPIAGLVIISGVARFLNAKYLAAFAIGLYLWFFSDTIGDASLLGVSEGFTGGVTQVALWGAFVVGLLLLVSMDRNVFSEVKTAGDLGFIIPLLVAIAVGTHGLGEGAAVGATAATTSSTNLLDAFGGVSAASSFVIHKALEPMIVGAAYWVYARNHADDLMGRVKDMAILTLAFTLPGIIGGASSYYLIQAYPGIDFTYVFALGLGTSIYALLRLARPLYQGTGSAKESVKVAIMIIVGFACLYTAALLHS